MLRCRQTTYQDVSILAHVAIGVGFDNALDCPAGIEFLSRCHVFSVQIGVYKGVQ